MEFNRNQYFFLGVVIVLLGLQVRMVSAYVLTPDATHFLADKTHSSSTSEGAVVSFASGVGALPNKVLHPPEWLGWCLISIGAVLILHSIAMPKPG
ncbi:MAG: hypothetical protein CMJ72_08355 [Planctomycetaceae bacterium]|nr:hypothetical protein [Planctomycetaceae bacterium]MCH2596584.1 hypothetical protein [Pirellulales bacterium]HCK40445.1 hypothetical protein [Planctomycetaceae bacterium]